MKSALLVYKTNPSCNVFNIGDYIQSLAARQFLNKENLIYINREELNLYDGESVKLILNGWFMHSPDNWPPSHSIHPLFVAFHLNSSVKEKLLNNETSVCYFKKYEPIGCRDQYTESLLQSKGIEAYFSGCMTLTLGLTYKTNRDNPNKIYFVDPPVLPRISFRFLFRGLYLLLFNWAKINKIYNKRFAVFSIIDYLKNLTFVEKYSRIFTMEVLEDAEYICHEMQDNFRNDDEKFRYADELLHKYASAKFVVTSRIHCALPCLGFETPVLYVYNTEQEEISTCRMGGLLELFHLIRINGKSIRSTLDIDKITVDTNFRNKQDYKIYRDALISRCKEFINDEE